MLLGAIAASRFIFDNNPNPGQSAILDSAFAWYRLDDVEPNGILFDSSSNAAHGTYSSNVLSTDGISSAESAYQPRGRENNLGLFYPNAAAWNSGANDPGGWIISFFMQKDASVAGGSVFQFLWGLDDGAGNRAGLAEDGGIFISLTASHYNQSTRPVLPVSDPTGVHMYTVAYRRNYAAEGRDKYAGYVDGVRVEIIRPNSSNPVNCGSSDMRAGGSVNYGRSYGNDNILNDMVSAPNPYTTNAAEEVAILELYNALK